MASRTGREVDVPRPRALRVVVLVGNPPEGVLETQQTDDSDLGYVAGVARVGGGHPRVWRVRRLERRRTRSGGRHVKFSSIDRPITLLCVHVPCRGGSLRRSRAHRRRSPIAPDVSGCMRGGWPPACAPALRQPAACPNAMALPGRVHTRTSSRASLSLQTPCATSPSLRRPRRRPLPPLPPLPPPPPLPAPLPACAALISAAAFSASTTAPASSSDRRTPASDVK